MDFRLTDELLEIRALAARMFSVLGDSDTIWTELGRTGLLGLALPEEHGGAGLGMDAACELLEEQGRTVSAAPVWPHIVAALALARNGFGDVLTGVAAGARRLTVALEEYSSAAAAAPACRATPTENRGDTWRLSGVKAAVPTPEGVDFVLVSAVADDGPGLYLVKNHELAWEPAPTTDLDRAQDLVLESTPALRVGGRQTLTEAVRWSRLAVAALQVGVADGALRLAADYVRDRRQFGRSIGSFQSVQHQLADCWTDVDAMRLTLWQALTFDTDGKHSDRAALVAAWWCGQAGLDVAHRVQHVHGGIGVDTDYPVHRHFLWGKQLAATFGGPEAVLQELGELLVAENSHVNKE
ncbi:acyl-CoA/acyl-ACP dehydrogenase [Nocardia sp. NEAU-G5]|uniref:Acyl-CoA/acyl-ACP dehydrogenase n=1 Tax=Nocardia albiluteola TaxID=2842303 RepID=A0ABS6AZM1_9NOCA|nr:acyl-CoA dehydrogenase family protein [Nocardia albiluteola]MBU3062444.1 acyl-CoA/acyl-ACP dehydrogenase [Nocardia albiluteola]